MHELAVTQSVLELALRHAERHGAARVTGLHLVLHFVRIRTRMRCDDCGVEYEPERGDLACPVCSGVHVQVVAGEEFRLDSIDVQIEDCQPDD